MYPQLSRALTPLAPLRHGATPSPAPPAPSSTWGFTRNDPSTTNYSVLPAWKKGKAKKKPTKTPTPWKVLQCNGLWKVLPLKVKEERMAKRYRRLFWKYSNGAKFWRCCWEFWSIRWHLPSEDTLSSCCKLTKKYSSFHWLYTRDYQINSVRVHALRGINWSFNLNQLLVNIFYWNKRKLEQWLLPPSIFGLFHSGLFWVENLNFPETKDPTKPRAGSGTGNWAAKNLHL